MNDPFMVSVILNTNRRADTLECLASLQANSYLNHKSIVLDNHSSDGSVEAIRSAFPQVQIVELEQNLGYAGNNNVGIEEALRQGADWVFVLNEDTLLAEDCLEKLTKVAADNLKIGVLGPMVYHADEPEVIQSAGGILNARWEGDHIGKNQLDSGQYTSLHQVDWISGCAIMVRREAIDQVGMIDTRFFYYWEETEWCVRIGKAGWKLVHVPNAKLWHKGVQRNYDPKPSVAYYGTRNHLLMLYKHRAPLTAKANAWFKIVRTLTSWTIKPKWRMMAEHRNAMWRGTIDFLRQHWGQMPVQQK